MRFPGSRLLAFVAAALLSTSHCPAGENSAPLTEGGSNFDFYGLSGSCDRDPFGVIKQFDVSGGTITAQLTSMYTAGQRRLRIGVFHQHGPDSGTTMDSSTGDLSPRNRANLAGLLGAVKKAGFQEVEVAFLPIGDLNPHNWLSWRQKSYEEDRNLITSLHPVIAAAGIPYRIDLLNEGMPMSDQPVLRDYAARLWRDYTAKFGKADTVGFSMTVWIADRATQLGAVYGTNPPDAFDVHLYGDSWNGDEYQQFVDADKKMTELGYHQEWIVGETYFDDPVAAAGIHRAIADTGRTVRYLTQWPLSRSQLCLDVDEAPPIDFGAFEAVGF